jgi:anti-sigma B factor antagonist
VELSVRDEGNVTIATLIGRMDIAGATAIDMPFSVLAGSKQRLIVDMAGVDFLASLGMRTLVMAAKSVASKGGKIALLGPQANVEKALRSSGIDTVIPIARDMEEATSLVA